MPQRSVSSMATALGFEYGRLKLSEKVVRREDDKRFSNPPDSTRQAARIILLSQTADSLMDGENSSIDSTANL